MFPQEQEDRDYNPQSELQNALEQSQQEFQDDSELVNRLRHMGRFVVVAYTTAFCPRTDAIMGRRTTLIGDAATEDEANTLAGTEESCEEVDIRILSPIKSTPLPPTNNDIPF